MSDIIRGDDLRAHALRVWSGIKFAARLPVYAVITGSGGVIATYGWRGAQQTDAELLARAVEHARDTVATAADERGIYLAAIALGSVVALGGWLLVVDWWQELMADPACAAALNQVFKTGVVVGLALVAWGLLNEKADQPVPETQMVVAPPPPSGNSQAEAAQ